MHSMNKGLATVLLSVLALSAATAQTAHTIYIDPVNNNGPTNWNNLAFNTLNNTMLLKDALTNATSIRATVTVRLNASNVNVSPSPTGDAAEFAPAGVNSAYGHSTDWSGTPPILYGEVVFSNLNVSVAYDFTFYASRIGVGDIRDARHTVTGSNSTEVVLDASNNGSAVVTAAGIYPDEDGVITLRIEKGPNNTNGNGFFYITAMKIVYTDPPPTTLFVDAAGSAASAGWNLLRMDGNSDTVLADTNGVSSGIRAQVTAPLGSVNNTLGTAAPVGDAAEFQPAGREACYGANTGSAFIKLYHLKPALGYTFTFYASRMGGTGTREAFYTVTGANSGSNTLESADNTQNVAVVSSIFPAPDGTLTVRISRGVNNTSGYNYLTAFKVTYVDNGFPLSPPAPIIGKRLLFFGNQYTSTENVPNLVAGLAELGGYPRPFVFSDTAGNRTLADQIARVTANPGFNVDYPLLDGTNTWDHVVIQGHGDEATSLGNVTAFRTNALALYQKVKTHASGKGAGAGAVLFQTWARGAGSAVYPGTFADPAAMQAEINANTAIASNNIVAAEGAGSVLLAPAGDAFAAGAFDATRLYAANLSDPAAAGPELAALALYKTLYGATATAFPYDAAVAAGLTTMSESDWLRVTHWADGLTPPSEPTAPAANDSRVFLIDACSNPVGSPIYTGWNYRSFNALGSVRLVLTNGYETPVTCEVVARMNGTAVSVATPTGDAAIFTRALANNAFGNVNPWGSNSYSNEFCEVRFSGLSRIDAYTFTFYASRAGATGRETLYLLDGANSGSASLEAGNNGSQVAVVRKIRPTADGTITLRVTSGPNNTSAEKFYHINALMIESTRSGLLMSVY